MNDRRRGAALGAGMVALMLAATAGCGGEEKSVQLAPVTPEMEKQAEASSNHLMDRMNKEEPRK